MSRGYDPDRVTEGSRRVTVSGCELRYLRVATGKPLVLLHTLRTQLEYFLPLLNHLDLATVEVVAPDPPGHGRSMAPRVAYTADYFTDTIEEVLTACAIRDAVVVGESIGASIALGLAARRSAAAVGGVDRAASRGRECGLTS